MASIAVLRLRRETEMSLVIINERFATSEEICYLNGAHGLRHNCKPFLISELRKLRWHVAIQGNDRSNPELVQKHAELLVSASNFLCDVGYRLLCNLSFEPSSVVKPVVSGAGMSLVNSCMVSVGAYKDVLRSVVKFISIDVMNRLARVKVSAELFLSNKTMEKNITVVSAGAWMSRHADTPVSHDDGLASLPSWVFFAAQTLFDRYTHIVRHINLLFVSMYNRQRWICQVV